MSPPVSSAAFPERLVADLAPGDAAAVDLDWTSLRIERVRSPDHPLFHTAYERLWREFGARGEMEKESVIAARLGWDPARPINHHALRYEMLLVLRGDEMVALRDHTAIVPRPSHRRDHPSQVIVHLSHLLVEPPLRGSGLSGWMRAFPIQTARECAAAAGEPVHDRITLVAEMEHPDGVTRGVMTRLRSYERAGFLKIDPETIHYRQPDFRPAVEIDRTSVQPVPLALVIRRVGREDERSITGADVRAIVAALYTVFAVHAREDHMAPLWALLDHFPGPAQTIALRPPLE